MFGPHFDNLSLRGFHLAVNGLFQRSGVATKQVRRMHDKPSSRGHSKGFLFKVTILGEARAALGTLEPKGKRD